MIHTGWNNGGLDGCFSRLPGEIVIGLKGQGKLHGEGADGGSKQREEFIEQRDTAPHEVHAWGSKWLFQEAEEKGGRHVEDHEYGAERDTHFSPEELSFTVFSFEPEFYMVVPAA